MGRGKQGGRGAASAEMQVCSITIWYTHNQPRLWYWYVKAGELLVIVISVPESVGSGEMTGRRRGLRRATDWTGRNRLLLRHVLAEAGSAG